MEINLDGSSKADSWTEKEKTNEAKTWFFEKKISKIDNFLSETEKGEKRKTKTINVKN